MIRRHLIILAKPPRLGRAKQRLSADIGATEALRFYRATLAQTIRRLGSDPRWQTWLFVDAGSARWPTNLPRRYQTRGDLGRRMDAALRSLPPGPVVLIGSDIPGASAAEIRAAFRVLAGKQAVFGPATDGGYWLVGLADARAAPKLFQGVRWSSKHALSDTLRNLRSPRRHAFATVLDDVDNGKAFVRWRSKLGPPRKSD